MGIALDQLEARDLRRMLSRTVVAPAGTAGDEKREFVYAVGG